MKPWTKIYMDYFGFDISDFMPCEICGAAMVDVHHIDSRGMGGSKDKDVIENLMGLCRGCHDVAHMADTKTFLREVHLDYMKTNKK